MSLFPDALKMANNHISSPTRWTLDNSKTLPAILPIFDCLDPRSVGQIPFHCFSQSTSERLPGLPAQVTFNLTCINSIAEIMPRTVHDVGDEALVIPCGIGLQFIKQATDALNNIQVGVLIMTANIVRLPWHAPADYGIDGPGVVDDVQPIPNIQARTVDW